MLVALIIYLFNYVETPPLIETQQEITSNETDDRSSNGFTKYLDISKTPLCVSTISINSYFFY